MHILHAAVELNHTLVATLAMELILEAASTDSLTLGESSQSQRQSKERGSQDKTKVDRSDHARTSTESFSLLQANQDQWRNNHDRCGVEDTADSSLTNGNGGSLLALAQALRLLALGTLFI